VVVRSELGSLGSDSLKDIRDERVEDSHGLVAELSARYSVDKRMIRLTRYQCRGGPA
jgi:hypothetical protein